MFFIYGRTNDQCLSMTKKIKKKFIKSYQLPKKGDGTLSVLQKSKNGIKNLREAEIILPDD